MAGFGKNLMYNPLSSRFISIAKFLYKTKSLEECVDLISNGQYENQYDRNKDGYLTKEDYDLLYDYTYSKYDDFQIPFNVKILAHMQKMINGTIPYDSVYDLANEGMITQNSMNIALRWLMYGKTPKAL